jgi:hypothetical protein
MAFAQGDGGRGGPWGGGGRTPTTLPNNTPAPNDLGVASSFSRLGPVDLRGSFFDTKLGVNGRACVTCHLPEDGWTISSKTSMQTFERSGGTDALFEGDGQNCIGDNRSSVQARRRASSLMINKALVRFDIPLAMNSEFEVVPAESDDVYCNVEVANSVRIYRRPLPLTNLGAIATVLWDARGNGIDPVPELAVREIFPAGVSLHAEGTVRPNDADIDEGTALILSLTHAQIMDNKAGRLDEQGARGGAEIHSRAPLTGPAGFDIFNAWKNLQGSDPRTRARVQIARGQEIFNSRTFPAPTPSGQGTCSGCHNVRNQGSQSDFITFNIGTADEALRTPDLPIYTLRNLTTGEKIRSSDPGVALTSGRWADIGKFKVATLRGLASRAPYFHNGLAKDLAGVVDFYDRRFQIRFTPQERADLIAFLGAL